MIPTVNGLGLVAVCTKRPLVILERPAGSPIARWMAVRRHADGVGAVVSFYIGNLGHFLMRSKKGWWIVKEPYSCIDCGGGGQVGYGRTTQPCGTCGGSGSATAVDQCGLGNA